VLKKGKQLSEVNSRKMEENGFTSMSFAGRHVWLKDSVKRAEFLEIDKMTDFDPIGPHPARYLNLHSFRAYLTLKSFTTRICELFHHLATEGASLGYSKQRAGSAMTGCEDARTATADKDAPMLDKATFTKTENFTMSSKAESRLSQLLVLTGSLSGISYACSAAVVNSHGVTPLGFFDPGDISEMKQSGFIFKFIHKLAKPDPNYIGDVIGRYFLAGLGDSHEEQLENYDLLKTGLSALRLTRLGDELVHLYRCLEIAIQTRSGLVPIFSNSTYEGCVVMGGPECSISFGGKILTPFSSSDLKNDFMNISDHASALSYISSKFPSDLKNAIMRVRSMYDLRTYCLSLEASADVRDDIIRRSAYLDFGVDNWVLSPSNLSECFSLIASPSSLDDSYPIGRVCLFSMDIVLVAMSCFGEKTAPSWDIPNGVACNLAGLNPPAPPASGVGRGLNRRSGETSDATWVMVIRQTDVFSAASEFREMAGTLKYRSSSSALARRVGHRVFSRDRMAEFWGDMREALRTINPMAAFEKEGGSGKRSLTESSATEAGDMVTKKRRLGF
jgi:hypothetical protein